MRALASAVAIAVAAYPAASSAVTMRASPKPWAASCKPDVLNRYRRRFGSSSQ